jgi:ligand-binding sensor domain-containing protein
MRTWLLLMVLLCNCLPGLGQPGTSYIFRHLSQRDGLLHNSVFSITQDADGYMWIGTANGLQRYDGIRFTNFQKGIRTLSAGAAPANIFTDKKGNVWFTCRDLVKLNKASNTIQCFTADAIQQDKSFSFTEYKDENACSWFVGNYGFYTRGTGANCIQAKGTLVPNNTAQTGNPVIQGLDGEIWLCNEFNRLLDRRKHQVFSVHYNPYHHPLLDFFKQTTVDKSLSFLMPDKKGNYWLATWDGRIVFFDKATGRSNFYTVSAIKSINGFPLKASATMIVTCLFQDSRGTIWAGTNNAGLLRFDNEKQAFSVVAAKDVSGYGVDYNFSFHCITEDMEGNLWLGTDKGISIFHPYRQYFKTISAQNGGPDASPNFEITSATGLSNGDMLVTTWGGGFCIFDSMYHRKTVVQPAGPYQYAMTWSALQVSSDTILIGAQHGYLYNYQPGRNTWTITRPPELMNSTIRCLAADNTGNIFMGLHNGHIVKWNGLSGVYLKNVASAKQAPVLNLLVQQQKIFAATENGLLVIDAASMRQEGRFIPVSNGVDSIRKLHGLAVLNDSIVLLGADNAGIFLFNIKTRIFLREPALALLEQQSVFAVRLAPDSSVWFTTDYALYHYLPITKKLVKLKPEQGRINAAFSQCNFSVTPSGKWLTSTEKEMVSFSPGGEAFTQATVREILLTGIKVMDQNLSIDSFATNRQVSLSHRQNFITFYFSDLSYNSIKEHVYYHRLTGVDKDWVQSGEDGMANYTNLPPGDYVFELKNDTAGDGNIVQWNISISAPFYATGWFKALTIILVAASIFWLIRKRIRTIRQQSELKHRIAEAEVSALRAQMNPHFIFNCLSAIDNMIETDQKDKATTYLNRFARLIRSVLESSKKSLVPLHSDMETLNLYLELEQFRCDNRFTYTVTADPQILNSDYKVPPLVVQPFVENAIHHGLLNLETAGGHLDVSLEQKENQLLYRIKDNGVGRLVAAELKHPAQKKHTSYGMEITEERIRMFNKDQVQQPVVITDLYHGNQPAGTLVEVFLKID